MRVTSAIFAFILFFSLAISSLAMADEFSDTQTNYWWHDLTYGSDDLKKPSQPVSVEKVEGSIEAEVDKDLSDDEDFFMGKAAEDEENIDLDLDEDDPKYVRSRQLLFVNPADNLGAKPLLLSLEDCIRIALVNNNKIQATEYGIDSAKAQLMEASAQFYPVFEYEWLSAPIPNDASDALGSFFRGELAWWNKIRVALGVPVYTFGKLSTAKDLARGGIVAAREMRKKEKISTVTSVRQLYYGILLAEELGRLITSAHDKLTGAINKSDGGRSPVDKLKAKVFLLDLENRLAETRDKELLALEGLRVQLGLSPDVAVMVYSDKLRPATVDLRPYENYIETALKNRPDVKLIEVGVQSRERQYKLEQRKFLPDVGVGAYMDIGATTGKVTGITTTDDYSDPFNFKRAGIGMQVKGKFDIHGQIARVRKAKSDYYKASLEHYMAKDGISLELKKAYLEANTALDDVTRADKAQSFARQLTFLTQSNSGIGVGEEQEYLDSLQMLLLTRGKYFEAVFNYNVALAVLDEKAGIIPVVDQ